MNPDSPLQRRPTDVVWLHRLFDWGAPRCPHFLEPVLRCGWVLIFYFLAARERRAICANLGALRAGRGRLATRWAAWRVFWNFAGSLVDGARLRAGEEFAWEVSGAGHFDRVERQGQGALVATAHMGTYDTAAGAFAARFPGGLELVRYREPDPRIDARRSAQLAKDLAGKVAIHYNEGADTQLGLELLRALRQKRSVAIQADRPLGGLSAVTVESGGLALELPDGPWVLAAAARVPVFPVFCWRVGRDRYRLRIGAAIEFTEQPGQRRPEVGQAMQAWASGLVEQLDRAWPQWFVFEPVLRCPDPARLAARPPALLEPAELILGRVTARRGWWEAGATALLLATLGLPWLLLPPVAWAALPVWLFVAALAAGIVSTGTARVFAGGDGREGLERQRSGSGALLLAAVAPGVGFAMTALLQRWTGAVKFGPWAMLGAVGLALAWFATGWLARPRAGALGGLTPDSPLSSGA